MPNSERMDAFMVLQIAVAVFLGNVMTLGLVRAWQRMKMGEDVSWSLGFYWLAPLGLTLVVLLTTW